MIRSIAAVMLGMVAISASAAEPGITKDHDSAKRNQAAEKIAVAAISRGNANFKLLKCSSADLADCLIWAGENNDSHETKLGHPSYFRPTDLKGWAVVFEADLNGDGKGDGSSGFIIDTEGDLVRAIRPSSVKFSGGKKARAAGAPTTRGDRPDADPLKDALKGE